MFVGSCCSTFVWQCRWTGDFIGNRQTLWCAHLASCFAARCHNFILSWLAIAIKVINHLGRVLLDKLDSKLRTEVCIQPNEQQEGCISRTHFESLSTLGDYSVECAYCRLKVTGYQCGAQCCTRTQPQALFGSFTRAAGTTAQSSVCTLSLITIQL